MGQVTKQDVAEIVRQMNAFYQPTEGACVATPAQLRLLLQKLRAYTEEVQKERNSWGLLGLGDSGGVAQWALDMANWQQRLEHYQKQLDAVSPQEANSKHACMAVYPTVTAPLLDGIYYQILPGVNLSSTERDRMVSGSGHPQVDVPTWFGEGKTWQDHPEGHSNPKPPDVATPFMLGNQVKEFQAHQQDRFRQFWADLKRNAQKLAKRAKDSISALERNSAWIGLGLVAGAAALAGGYWWLSTRPQRAPRRALGPGRGRRGSADLDGRVRRSGAREEAAQ